MIVKKTLKFTTKLLAVVLIIATLISGTVAFAAKWTDARLDNAPELYNYLHQGYRSEGGKGPIIITEGTLKNKNNNIGKKSIYLVTFAGLQIDVKYQATNLLTCLKVGTNLPNDYFDRATAAIMGRVPKNANIVLAGHSLGGMVAQQLAANPVLRARYKILNTVTFGSPLIAAGFREGSIQRLGHELDYVPYLSTNTLITPIRALAGLNRVSGGGYGTSISERTRAHCEAYGTDLFKDYDVLGYKNGKKVIELKLNTEQFYYAPCYLGLPY
ncbi:MAG: hypothetical protein IJJ43_03710 [Oscillospiraceae bacterium]|nr:hypothetical protein [Oscillospiraceae bacterium]